MKLECLLCAFSLVIAAGAAELKNGSEFSMDDVPSEMSAHLKRGGSVRFLLEENRTTGYQWEAICASNECVVAIEHRPAGRGESTEGRSCAPNGLCGAPGKVALTVTKNAAVQSPSLVEFVYRRSWEKGEPAKRVRLVLYTIPGEAVDFRYPASRTLNMLKAECRNRGIELIDWHVHIRGGLTPEMAAERERASGIRQSAMENHGREWEIFDNARLVAFAEKAREAKVGGHTLPVGIQVNDRDWFRQIDAATREKFDYILADTMIMGKLPNGRDKRLWLVNDLAEIGDPEQWMDEYVAMNLQILGEPISILANPGYLPAPLDAMHDRLWTEKRMRAVIGKAVERGIAIEIQAESPYPSPKFLRLAKSMGAKFSFGTNNYDAAPKDLSRWLEAIVWLDLKADDIWSPKCLKSCAAAPVRVGSFNIRLESGDRKTANNWDLRKKDLTGLIRKMNLDAFGLQEVRPLQAQYLREELPEYAFVGDHRGADRKSDEASPVFYRKSRFEALKSGTFWLSETPDVPGVKGWGAACPRVCSWMWLKDKTTGRAFCFANTHTDHKSARARKEGMLLIIRRMKEFAGDAPIVFTGDHNCRETEEPAQAVSKLLDNAILVSETPPMGSWRTFNGWRYVAEEFPAAEALMLSPAVRNARLGSPDAERDAQGRHRYESLGARIDYIYVTPGVKVRDYVTYDDVRPGTTLYPSDHFPIVATIEL